MKLDQWTVILILGITLIVVFVWLGVENKWFQPKNSLNIVSGEGNVRTDENGNVSSEYTRIAQYAHDQISGVNWNFGNIGGDPAWMDVIVSLYKLSDNELRVVSNEYDRLFSPDTLRGLINSESTGCWSKSSYNPTDACYKYYEVKDRLNNINA